MLREVLQAIEAADGPITLNELSRRLDIDPGVLDGMLSHWSRRGRVTVDTRVGVACAGSPASGGCSCGSGGSGVACPFVARLPRAYLILDGAIEDKGSE